MSWYFVVYHCVSLYVLWPWGVTYSLRAILKGLETLKIPLYKWDNKWLVIVGTHIWVLTKDHSCSPWLQENVHSFSLECQCSFYLHYFHIIILPVLFCAFLISIHSWVIECINIFIIILRSSCMWTDWPSKFELSNDPNNEITFYVK